MDDQNDVPAEALEVAKTDNPQLDNRLNLESLINRYVGDIEKLREQLKTQKDMLEDAFNNNPEYAEASQKVKDATKLRTGIKQKILKDDAVAFTADKVNGIRDEIKDAQDALSGYLQKYFQTVGTNQITGDDGEIREIVVVTKLVKKSSKYKP